MRHAGPRPFTRRTAAVHAMPLGTPADLALAEVWLRQHGVTTERRVPQALRIHGLSGEVMTARLGQWLVHDPAVGAFTVEDDQHFRACHQAAS